MSVKGKIKRRDFLYGISTLPLVGASLGAADLSKAAQGDQPESKPEKYPAFTDARSKKVIFAAHCILNQNARIDRCAYTPSAIEPVVRELLARKIGIVQLPCPETEILGLGRGAGAEIYDLLSEPEARRRLDRYVQNVLALVREYRKYGFKVLGVLGLDGSPCCGVDLHYYKGEKPGSGALMEELIPVLEKEEPPVKVRGVQDAKPEEAVALIGELDSSM